MSNHDLSEDNWDMDSYYESGDEKFDKMQMSDWASGLSVYTSTSAVIDTTSNGGYFYLDPVIFAKATQSFSPTFNTNTDAMVEEAYDHFMQLQPITAMSRADAADGTSYNIIKKTTTGGLIILISCDYDDPYGLPVQAYDMFTILSASTTESLNAVLTDCKSATVTADEDGYSGGCGHCMDIRDFVVAYMWFFDIFETFTGGSVDYDVDTYTSEVRRRGLLYSMIESTVTLALDSSGEYACEYLSAATLETTDYVSTSNLKIKTDSYSGTGWDDDTTASVGTAAYYCEAGGADDTRVAELCYAWNKSISDMSAEDKALSTEEAGFKAAKTEITKDVYATMK
jgi:hypothetical protein